MNTEITKVSDAENAVGGWIFYDDDCPRCRALARLSRNWLLDRGFHFAPLQEDWVRQVLGPTASKPTEMKLLTGSGLVLGGADALVRLAREIWFLRPFTALTLLPGMLPLLRGLYRRFAANRSCRNGSCAQSNVRPRWMPLGLLVLLASSLGFAGELPPWVFMWLLALTIGLGCKWLTWVDATQTKAAAMTRTLAYFLLWPGMNARAFLHGTRRPSQIPAWDLFLVLMKMAIGAVLVWLLVPTWMNDLPLLAAWAGWIGLGLMVHFGAFHFLALFWQSRGIVADRLMRSPLRATALNDFWSRRWNVAFRDLAHRYLFLPAACMWGPGVGLFVSFFASGLIHELVISVPAGGGYGGPTIYFLVQALGIGFERSRAGRFLGLGHGWRGWLFTMCCTAGPAYWLFHPTFMIKVVAPFLEVLGAA